MSDKNDENTPKIGKEDADLWQSMTQDVERLPGKEYAEFDEIAEEDDLGGEEEQLGMRETVIAHKKEERHSRFRAKDVDRRTQDRLKKGKMEIEAKLDLHGFTQDEAHKALEAFILSSYARGHRCVLVVTGKGRTQPGVLKQRVPEWLQQGEMGPVILQSHIAKQHHGGEGALYVLLRRQRNNG